MHGYFDRQRTALVDSTHRSRVNFEFYYFADEAGKKRFDADALRWCGMVTDPVSRERFRPTSRSAVAEHRGVPFFFTSEENRLQFAAHADSLSVIRTQMRDMERDMPPRSP